MLEVDLSVSQGPKTAGSFVPGLVATVNTDSAIGSKFRILYMERFDPISIQFDEIKVVKLLEYKMAGIVSQAGRRMVIRFVQEHFIRGPII